MLPVTRLLALVPPPLGVVAGAWWVQQLPSLPGIATQAVLALSGLVALALAVLLARQGLGAAAASGRGSSLIQHAPSVLSFAGLLLLSSGWAIVQADRALAERITIDQEGIDLVAEGHVEGLPIRMASGWRFGFRVERCGVASSACPQGRLVALHWGHGFGARFADGELANAGQRRDQAVSTHGDRRHGPPADLRPGERWQLTIRLKRPRANHNPGLFDAELRMLQQGIAATGYVRPVSVASPSRPLPGEHRSIGIAFDQARHHLRAALLEAFGPEASASAVAGVLVALAVGDQAAIPNRWWEIFNRTGVGHLMSISGLHITMLAGLAIALCRRLLRWPIPGLDRLLLRWPAPCWHWGAGLLVAFSYAGLAGWGIPAQRTCWMLAVTAWALLSGRCRGIGPALALAAAVVTVIVAGPNGAAGVTARMVDCVSTSNEAAWTPPKATAVVRSNRSP